MNLPWRRIPLFTLPGAEAAELYPAWAAWTEEVESGMRDPAVWDALARAAYYEGRAFLASFVDDDEATAAAWLTKAHQELVDALRDLGRVA